MRIYKSNEVDDQRFYKIPKSLFGNPNYKGMSAESKLVYAFLRDRMELSKKNGWITDTDEIYLLFSRDNIAELLEMSLPTVTKAFKQLTKYKLILEKRQGLGRPNIIFVCHIELSQEIQQKQNSFVSGSKEILHQDIKKLCPSDTEYIETENSETDNNDNGAFSREKRTTHSLFEELPYRQEVTQARQYFEACYRTVYRQPYHNHKPAQNKYIDERLSSVFDEYTIDIETMGDMIRAYFKIDCDHNLMHFVTDGIIQNRVYEAAAY